MRKIEFLRTRLAAATHVVTTAARRCWAFMAKRRERYSTGALVVQSPLLFVLAIWWYWIRLGLTPAPIGFAIGGLGFIAVIMTVRVEFKWTRIEQAVWIVIAFLLFSLESTTLFQDRDEQNAQHAEEMRDQTAQFDKVLRQNQLEFRATMDGVGKAITTTGVGIKINQKGFQSTLQEAGDLNKKSIEILAAAQKGVEATTGEGSFAYLTIDLPAQAVTLSKIGKAPLYLLQIDIWSEEPYPPFGQEAMIQSESRSKAVNQEIPEGKNPLAEYFLIKNLPPRNSNFALGEKKARFDIHFTARHGFWWEREVARKVPDPNAPNVFKWSKAIRVVQENEGAILGKILFERIDQDFPKDALVELSMN